MRLFVRRLALAAAAALAWQASTASAYTAEQSATGRSVFGQFCTSCHGDDLKATPNAALVGPDFVGRWQGRTTNDLLALVRATMPPESPGSLSEGEYLAAVAFLLQANGGKAGAEPLTATAGGAIGGGAAAVARAAPQAAGSARAAPAAGAGAARAEPAPEPLGITVAGTVPDFAPLTDQTLRNPAPGDWPILRRDYAPRASARSTKSRRRTSIASSSHGFGRCAMAAPTSPRRSRTAARCI